MSNIKIMAVIQLKYNILTDTIIVEGLNPKRRRSLTTKGENGNAEANRDVALALASQIIEDMSTEEFKALGRQQLRALKKSMLKE